MRVARERHLYFRQEACHFEVVKERADGHSAYAKHQSSPLSEEDFQKRWNLEKRDDMKYF